MVNSLANVLIDTSASHSFIASSFASILGLEFDLLECHLLVETPIMGKVALGRVCRSFEIDVADHRLSFDFIVLDMNAFDVILSID